MTKRRKKVLGGVAVLIIVLAGFVIHIISTISQPVTADLQTGPAQSTSGYDINLTPETEVGKYASFNYPSGLKMDAPGTFGSPILEQLNFRVRDVESWLLTVNVSSLPEGQLSQNSSYSYRKAHPDVFRESQETVNGQPIDLMTDVTASGFAQVAFIEHGSEVGIVSLTGDDSSGTGPLQTTFNMVLQSWHWLQ